MGTDNQRMISFTRDGLVFDVRDAGPIDGTPVVLLHGFPRTHARGTRSPRCCTRVDTAPSHRTSAATPLGLDPTPDMLIVPRSLLRTSLSSSRSPDSGQCIWWATTGVPRWPGPSRGGGRICSGP